MPTKFILIRHGQTDWNLNKRYSGYLDVSLNQNGKAQAKRLHHRLKTSQIDKIYSSDRIRAIQTAKIVFKNREIEKIADLREVHFGVFEGLTYQEIIKKHPIAYKKWLKNPYSIKIPKGEHLTDFKKRIVKAFRKIAILNKNKTVAIVSHGGVISIFVNHLLKSKKFWQQVPSSASLSIVEYNKGKAKIKLFNDFSHLNQDPVLQPKNQAKTGS